MKRLIYVAYDEKNIRSLMKTFLENEGYKAEVFSDGYSVKLRRIPRRLRRLF